MAKGVEDTAFYRYARLLALNDVGGDPGRFGIGPDRFHAANVERARRLPNLRVGLHVVLTDGAPVSPRGEVPGLMSHDSGLAYAQLALRKFQLASSERLPRGPCLDRVPVLGGRRSGAGQ